MSALASAPVFVPMGYQDNGRSDKCWPTNPVDTAHFDREKIKCYYRTRLFCFNLDDLAARTYLDVYPNGVLVNVPQACCCCCVKDNARFIFFDGKLFGRDPAPGGCCKPYPYWCPHCFNVCGETLAFQPLRCVGCADGGMHEMSPPTWCCPYDMLCGLVPGEPARLSALLSHQKQKFEQAGKVAPRPTPQGSNQMQVGGGGVGGLHENML